MATVTACAALRISAADWRWILLSIGLVLAAEAFNTALERACDAASPDFHPLVKAAKDAAAGGVLIAAATSAAIGGLTLYPYVCRGDAQSGWFAYIFISRYR